MMLGSVIPSAPAQAETTPRSLLSHQLAWTTPFLSEQPPETQWAVKMELASNALVSGPGDRGVLRRFSSKATGTCWASYFRHLGSPLCGPILHVRISVKMELSAGGGPSCGNNTPG
jgi:hypothetical protein